MRSYQTARTLFSILEIAAWCAVVVGVLALLFGFSNASQSREFGMAIGAAAILPGALLVLIGLLGAAQAQIGRAGVDTAEYSQQMLKIARDHLEVSHQALRGGGEAPTSFASRAGSKDNPARKAPSFSKPKQAPSDVPQIPESTTYKGKAIQFKNGKFLYGGIPFESRERAEKYIDQFAEPQLTAVNQEAKR